MYSTIILTALVASLPSMVSSLPTYTPISQTFRFVAVAPNSTFSGYTLEAYHVGAGESVASLVATTSNTDCNFFIDPSATGGDLGFNAGTPPFPDTASLAPISGHNNVIQFEPSESSGTSWSVKDAFLLYDSSPLFYVCPEVLPYGEAKDPIVGIGAAPDGCFDTIFITASCEAT